MSYDYLPTSKIKPAPVDEIRILIVDDQSFARKFLKMVCEADTESKLKVVGMASNGEVALEKIETLQPHVVIIDIEMPGMNGISLIQIIAQKHPHCKVMVFSSHDNVEYLKNALKTGVKGYLLKTTPGEELRNAIINISKGYYQIGPGLLEKTLTTNSNTTSDTLAIAQVPVSPKPDLEPLKLNPQSQTQSNSSSAIEVASNSIPEVGWSGSTQELINTLPRVWSRGLVYLMTAFIAVGLPWTILARIDETGTARGKIEPKGKTLRLDTPISGQVTEVHGKEGLQVKAGEKLLTIESKAIASQLQQEQEKLKGLQNQLKELKSVKNQHLQALNTQNQQNQAQITEKQAQLSQAQQDAASLTELFDSQKQEKQAQLEQAQKIIETSKAAYELAQIRLQSAKEKVPRYQQAFKDGAISQDRLLETTQLAQEAQKELEKSQLELEQSRSSFKEIQSSYQTLLEQETTDREQAKLRVSEQEGGYNSLLHTNDLALLDNQEKIKDATAKISALQGEIAQTASKIESWKFQLTQHTIKAPKSGTIFQFPIQNVGANVQSGDTVAMIAQTNNSSAIASKENLVLRAKMPSSETAFVKTGLPAKIKLDAYPFQDYGVVDGSVSWISPDSKVDNNSQPSLQQEFFEIEVSLEQNYLEAEPKPISLTPGQTGTAEVVIRQRRLIDFFLDPFKKLQKGGIDL